MNLLRSTSPAPLDLRHLVLSKIRCQPVREPYICVSSIWIKFSPQSPYFPPNQTSTSCPPIESRALHSSKISRSRHRFSLPIFTPEFPLRFSGGSSRIPGIDMDHIYNARGGHLWLWSVAIRKRGRNVIFYNQSCNTDITSEKFAVLFCLCSTIEYGS